jgi:thymidylate synthase
MNKISIDWIDLLHDIMLHGKDQSSREGTTKELLNRKLEYSIYNSFIDIPERGINPGFITEEANFAISGKIEPESALLKKVLKAWINEFGIYSGSYGPQFLGQLDYILETLKRNPDSRQAVMTIWKENPRPQLNVPCLTQMHFLSREDKLHCFATMRSSDAYLGLPNDIGVFAIMTTYIAMKLKLEPGTMYLNMHSVHLYEKHWELANAIIIDNYAEENGF